MIDESWLVALSNRYVFLLNECQLLFLFRFPFQRRPDDDSGAIRY